MAGLKEAVQLGADVNASDQFGQTVLVWAAYTGTTEMAELLIDAGADPNLGRNPPLHYAARFGRSAMVQVIVQACLLDSRHTMLTGFDASTVLHANQ
jgi:ankyrin repeat protein